MVIHYTTRVLTANGYIYTALGGSLLAGKLSPGGAQLELLWSYKAPGGAYLTTMHVLSDDTLVIGSN